MRLTLLTSIVALAVLAAAAPRPMGRGIGMSIPITKRSRLVNPDGTVNIEALHADAASARAKMFRGFASFEKNTGAPHPAAPKGTWKRDTGQDSMMGDNNSLWYGTISVGTPPTDFTVQFDTGSSDLFLPGSGCTSNCDGHTIYDPSASSTSRNLDKSVTLKFQDEDSAKVEEYTDTVTVAGLTATEQTLGAATQYSSGLSPSSYTPDGLMGMAFQLISQYNAPPVFQTLVSQGRVDQAEFSFELAETGSELYLGGKNSGLYTGDFTYMPITEEGFWEVDMDSIDANGKTILTNIDSVIDTGTTLIHGVSSQVADLYNTLGGTDASNTVGQGYYTLPCDSFPSISFTFGYTSFPISADILNPGRVSWDSNDCVSGIVGDDSGSSSWTIGDVFLRNVYTTFDLAGVDSQPLVGFAQLA